MEGLAVVFIYNLPSSTIEEMDGKEEASFTSEY